MPHRLRKSMCMGVIAVIILAAIAVSGTSGPNPPLPVCFPQAGSGCLGPVPCSLSVGDPISAITGNMYYEVTDVVISSDYDWPLTFTRSYNSAGKQDEIIGDLGPKWTHSFSARLIEDSLGWVTLIESTGRHVFFNDFKAPSDLAYRLEYDSLEKRYSVIMPDNKVLDFNAHGRLSAIRERDYARIELSYDGDKLVRATDASGRYLAFDYNDRGRIKTISLADGSTYLTFDYGGVDNIVSKVTYADGTWESYEYGSVEKAADLMVTRCTSDGVCQYYRYDKWTRAVAHCGNDSVNLVTIFFSTEFRSGKTYYCSTVKDEDTVFYTSEFVGNTGRRKLIKKESISSFMHRGEKQDLTVKYDSAGRETSSREGERIIDSLAFDTLGREMYRYSRLDKSGQGEYSTSNYHPSRFNLESGVSNIPDDAGDTSLVRYEYDGFGNVMSVIEYYMNGISGTAAGKSKMEYNDRGQLVYFNGPEPGEIDAVWLNYYANGDLRYCSTNQGMRIEYGPRDMLGNPTWVEHPDGSRYDYRYDERGRPISISACIPNYDCQVMSCEYNFAGDVTHAKLPNGAVIDYVYDNHGWLVEANNSREGKARFTYDSYGNTTDVLLLSPSGDTLDASEFEAR